MMLLVVSACFFFFNAPATTEIYTLSLHDALPIYKLEGAVVVVEPATGNVLAMVGGRASDTHGFNRAFDARRPVRSEEHTSELQSHVNLVCRLLLEKKKKEKKTASCVTRPIQLAAS